MRFDQPHRRALIPPSRYLHIKPASEPRRTMATTWLLVLRPGTDLPNWEQRQGVRPANGKPEEIAKSLEHRKGKWVTIQMRLDRIINAHVLKVAYRTNRVQQSKPLTSPFQLKAPDEDKKIDVASQAKKLADDTAARTAAVRM